MTAVDVGEDKHWTDPGVELVAPGVHRVPLPLPLDGLRAVNVYVLETDAGLTCIDAGWAIQESRELFGTSLRSIGHDLSDITRFLVTHVHRDHYTQAVTVRSEFGRATVELGIGERSTLDLLNGGPLENHPTVTRLERAGAPDVAAGWSQMFEGRDPELEMWGPPDSWLEGDHLIEVGERTLRAVPTPGHTAGHFVFADEQAGILFAGDHVLPTITPSIGFELAFRDDPLGDFLGSLHTVRQLPDLRLLPAHGAVTESSHTRIDELLAHHDHRLDLCRDAVVPDGSTAYDVAQRLTWTRHERALDELDLFNCALATLETMVHLDLLVNRGQLTRETIEGSAVYRALAAGRGER
jgi:glyoxylase-like metal-dependent hydrolase (beta-lactamase superfamily II)